MKDEVFADLGTLNNATIGIKTPVQSNAVSISERAGVTPVKLFVHDLDAENTDPNTLPRPPGLVKDEKNESIQLEMIKETQQEKEAKDVADLFFGDRSNKKRKAGFSPIMAKKFKATNTQNLAGSVDNEGSLTSISEFHCMFGLYAPPMLGSPYTPESSSPSTEECSPAEYQFVASFLS